MKVTLKIQTEDEPQYFEVPQDIKAELHVDSPALKLQSVPTYVEKFMTLVFPSPIIVKGGGGGGASRLRDLEDVNITFPGVGDFLVFDGNVWVNKTDDFDLKYLRKDKPDTAHGHITFKDGVRIEGDTVITGEMGSEEFSSGFGGVGWKMAIDKNNKQNHLTVDNLTVRGALSVYELVINQIHATNGSLWVSDSVKLSAAQKITPASVWYTVKEASGEIKAYMDIYPEDSTILYTDSWVDKDTLNPLCRGYNATDATQHFTHNPTSGTDFLDIDIAERIVKPNEPDILVKFYHDYYSGDFYKLIYEEDSRAVLRVNDLVKCQKWDDGVKLYNAIVTETFSSFNTETELTSYGCIVRLAKIPFESMELVEPVTKDTVVRIGNTVDVHRQGAIYLTSSEKDGPYIDILDKVNTPAYAGKLPTVRLGNLSGIKDPAFGNLTPVKGTGLYASNGYFKGRQVSITADGDEIPVVIYRGAWNADITYSYGDQVSRNIDGSDFLYTALDVNEVNKNKPPESNILFWKPVVTVQDGKDAKVLMLTGPSIFYYQDEWEELLTDSITKKIDAQNLTQADLENIHWYIQAKKQDDNSEIWVNYSNFVGKLEATFYPTDEALTANLGNPLPRGYTLWNKNMLKIQACVGLLGDPTNPPAIFDIETLGKVTGAKSPYELSLISSRGILFKEGVYETIISALVYHKGKLIQAGTDERKAIRVYWEIQDKNGETISTLYDEDSFKLTNNDVNFKVNIVCTIYSSKTNQKLL